MGVFCTVDIDECKRSQPCQNSGLCRNHNNGYTCDCAGTGFEGMIGYKLTSKRNATIEFCQVRHVVHKHKLHKHNHKLTMTRTLSKASGLFEFIDFCLSGMLANIHEYFNCCHYFYFLLDMYQKFCIVAFLLPISIDLNESDLIDLV